LTLYINLSAVTRHICQLLPPIGMPNRSKLNHINAAMCPKDLPENRERSSNLIEVKAVLDEREWAENQPSGKVTGKKRI